MKKMRLLGLLTLALLSVGSVNSWAQGKYGKDSVNCVNYLNFYNDYYKQGNLKEAAPLWVKAMQVCPPTANHNLLIAGRKILQYKIANYKGDAAGREKLIDSLLTLSDVRAATYPKYALAANENKAFDLITYRSDADKKIFDQIDAIIQSAGNKTNRDLLVMAMAKASELYKAKKMTDADVLAVYSELSPIMEAKVLAEPDMDTKTAQAAFDNAFITSGVANCNNLITVFTPRYEATPTDLGLVKTIAKLLSDNDCLQSDLFLKAVTSLNQLEPSYNSAYLLYRLHSSKDNNDEALKYLQAAVDSPESDAIKDGELLMEMATYYFKKANNPTKAVQMAKEASSLNSAISGKADFLIGTIWINQRCNGNEIDQRAKYWVAVDYLTKAKAADPSVIEEADKLISQCRQYFPKAEDAFMYDVVDGKSYSVSCGGMSATTTVRTVK
ncbi:MAG: hypothetical protein RR555_00625 [Bacteroidales bacterium]